jgi:hypothetical protein
VVLETDTATLLAPAVAVCSRHRRTEVPPSTGREYVARMALPRGLVADQGLTWVGAPASDGLVAPGDRGSFIAYEGDPESYVVQFNDTMFCCDAADVRPDPRPPVPVTRRHNAQ